MQGLLLYITMLILVTAWGMLIRHHWTGEDVWVARSVRAELAGSIALPVALVVVVVSASPPLIPVEWNGPLIWLVASGAIGMVLSGLHALVRTSGTVSVPRDLALSTVALWFVVLSALLALELGG